MMCLSDVRNICTLSAMNSPMARYYIIVEYLARLGFQQYWDIPQLSTINIK